MRFWSWAKKENRDLCGPWDHAHGSWIKAGDAPSCGTSKSPLVAEIHRRYYEPAQTRFTNTFGGNPSSWPIGLVRKAEIINAEGQARKRGLSAGKFVAGKSAPLGKLLKPLGGSCDRRCGGAFFRQAQPWSREGGSSSARRHVPLEEASPPFALQTARMSGHRRSHLQPHQEWFFTMMGEGVARLFRHLEEAGADVHRKQLFARQQEYRSHQELRATTTRPDPCPAQCSKPETQKESPYTGKPLRVAQDGQEI